MRLTVFIFSCILVLTWAADGHNVELVGKTHGTATDVYVVEDYAYLCTATALVILDVSDPENPREVASCEVAGEVKSSYPVAGNTAVHVVGNYAYVAGRGGIGVVDVSDPKDPQQVAFYYTCAGKNSGATDVYVVGNYAYVGYYLCCNSVGMSNAGLLILDVSDPRNPSEVGFYDLGLGRVEDIYVANDYAYFFGFKTGGTIAYGAFVVDISVPANPREVAFRELGWARICFADGYVYANTPDGLRTMDMSDPRNPREVSLYNVPGRMFGPYGIYVDDGCAYKVEEKGLQLVDVSDPESPREVAFYSTLHPAKKVYVAKGYAYLIDWKGLRIIDISIPENPREVGSYSDMGGVWDIHVIGSYAYVTDRECLRVIDVSDPKSPHVIGVYSDPDYISESELYAAGSYAYRVSNFTSFYVMDISDPRNLRVLGSCDYPCYAQDIYVAGGYAYLTCVRWDNMGNVIDTGLRVIDVSNPKNPHIVGTCNTPYPAAIYVVDNYTYLACAGNLHVMDISDPKNPREVSFYDSPGGVSGIYVSDSYAYMAERWKGWHHVGALRIIDVSDPNNLREVGVCDIAGEAESVSVEHGYACVTGSDIDGAQWLRVIDISDPTNPHEVGFYEATNSALKVQAVGGYAYMAGGEGGLLILRYAQISPHAVEPDTISQFSKGVDGGSGSRKEPSENNALFQNFPNPFNPDTWIPYQLKEYSEVTIRIYNMAGQLVRTLSLGSKSAGVYCSKEKAAHWDGKDEFGEQVSSGVYFCTIQAGNFTATKKMVVTKQD